MLEHETKIIIIILFLIIILFILYLPPLLTYKNLPKLINNKKNNLILYRTFHDRTVTKKMFNNCHQKWLDLNPGLVIEWYTDKDCDKYMSTTFKVLYGIYKTLKPGAFKADLFRLCILYERGGIYADACTMPYKSIKWMLEDCYKNKERQEQKFISVLDSSYSGGGIHNGFIYCTPKHPFIKACIDTIIENVVTKNYTNCVLGVTGPICLRNSIFNVLLKNGKIPDNSISLGMNAKPSKNYNYDNGEFIFKEGFNDYEEYSFYLFKFKYGPSQFIYKNDTIIMSKKHCLVSYLLDKLKPNTYTKQWTNKDIYNL